MPYQTTHRILETLRKQAFKYTENFTTKKKKKKKMKIFSVWEGLRFVIVALPGLFTLSLSPKK